MSLQLEEKVAHIPAWHMQLQLCKATQMRMFAPLPKSRCQKESTQFLTGVRVTARHICNIISTPRWHMYHFTLKYRQMALLACPNRAEASLVQVRQLTPLSNKNFVLEEG